MKGKLVGGENGCEEIFSVATCYLKVLITKTWRHSFPFIFCLQTSLSCEAPTSFALSEFIVFATSRELFPRDIYDR